MQTKQIAIWYKANGTKWKMTYANRTRFKFENNGNTTERKYDQMKIQHNAITTKCKYDIMWM